MITSNRIGHPADYLADFCSVMHTDGYGGYKKLYGNQIIEAACMAHVRRKFHDVIKLKPSPIADEALALIGALYDIEDRIRGMSAEERRTLRQEHAKPILRDLNAWIEDTQQTLPQKQKLAETMRYTIEDVATMIGENLERLQEIAANSNNIDCGEIVHVHNGTKDDTTGFTRRGIESFWEFLAEIRS